MLIAGYLRGAVFARVGRLSSLFRDFLSSSEIDEALRALAAEGTVVLSGSGPAAIAVRSSSA